MAKSKILTFTLISAAVLMLFTAVSFINPTHAYAAATKEQKAKYEACLKEANGDKPAVKGQQYMCPTTGGNIIGGDKASFAAGGESAATQVDAGTSKGVSAADGNGCTQETPLSIPVCSNEYYCPPGDSANCLKNNPIIVWINFLINVLAAVVGVGAVAMLVFAGVQYTTAGDKPDQVEAAKKKIGAVVIGLVAFIFLYAFLNWLIPGGVIG